MDVKKSIVVVLVLVGTVIMFNKPIIKYFVEQSANPTGFIGRVMIKIWNTTFEDMANWGINKLNINEESIILDVGCGGGKTIYTLSEKTAKGKVYGIDISEESVQSSIKENKEKVKDRKVIISQGDVANLPFEDNYFNYVTSMQTHIYWQELEKGFKEIYRVLKKDGILLIVCEKDKIEYHLKEEYKSNNSTKELLLSIGFNEVKIEEKGKRVLFICKKD